MEIDIIIPTFNRAQVLKRAIESVLNQTYQNFSLFIVDDGSTDETPIFLKQIQNNKKVKILSQKNLGVSAARNLAIKTSKSPWISFLDSDDEWLPEKLMTQVNFIQNNPEVKFVHTQEQWIRNGVRVNPHKKHNKNTPDIFLESLERCLISPSTVIMKRELFSQTGLFNEELPVCEDYDLWNKILARNNVHFIDVYLTKKYGGHNDQLSNQYFAMDYFRIKSLLELLKEEDILMDKKLLIKNCILKKGEILKKGYLKHQNFEKSMELEILLKLPILH
jgi:glycosyltransferase involved in cell wall biosynthesis